MTQQQQQQQQEQRVAALVPIPALAATIDFLTKTPLAYASVHPLVQALSSSERVDVGKIESLAEANTALGQQLAKANTTIAELQAKVTGMTTRSLEKQDNGKNRLHATVIASEAKV